MNSSPALADPWTQLRRFTSARIAPGRAGGSATTRAQLAFALDHALARDAVHAPFDAADLAAQLHSAALPALALTSAAPDRATFLQRPDLGRRLSAESVAQLSALAARLPPPPDLVVLVSDGLSALAVQRQAAPLLAALVPRLRDAGFSLAPLLVVRHARVALIDEVAPLLRARLALILLGERPGLGTPDSLGAYFGFEPQPGRTDADRNCISNIRPGGLAPVDAAALLAGQLTAARDRRLSGVRLKFDGPATLA